MLLAATGVGAGDLATSSFVGGLLGTAVLWAVVVGAFFKFVVTEGLARFQLATGETLIEGAVARLGRGVVWLFLPYLLLWSFFVGSALMSATGARCTRCCRSSTMPSAARSCSAWRRASPASCSSGSAAI
ncbi:Nramp family divalent metal transporter, partial [Methyloceanibacter marginalis]|uniref:Nramp family divalent metal transporter n=1 Tax=Methyloceanibacter marginalis TaxID=1774971 RepID=UPI001874C22A